MRLGHKSLRERADVVIIGSGIIGLSTAYNLAKKGQNSVEVLEKNYVGSGASTRNAEHVGTNYLVRDNAMLASESLKIWRKLSSELGFNMLFYKQNLFELGYHDRHLADFATILTHHRDLGLRSKSIDATELKAIMPFLNVDGVLQAAWYQSDGKAHHDAVIWAYAKRASELGAGINTYTPALNIRVENGKVDSVVTAKGPIKAGIVINAAGAWAKEVASWAGVDLPVASRKREILVTEPLKHFLDHYVVCKNSGIYFNQTLRGEIVGAGIEGKLTTTTFDNSASTYFAKKYAKSIVDVFPNVAHVNVMRQWAGLRDRAVDHNPIVGWIDGVAGFYQANAFYGHGFGWGPVIGKLIAEDILDGKASISLDRFHLDRFKEGGLVHEATY